MRLVVVRVVMDLFHNVASNVQGRSLVGLVLETHTSDL